MNHLLRQAWDAGTAVKSGAMLLVYVKLCDRSERKPGQDGFVKNLTIEAIAKDTRIRV